MNEKNNASEQDRAAKAFRTAMADLQTPGAGELDPEAAQRRATSRRNARLVIGGLVLILIAAAGAITVPTFLRPDRVAQPAAVPDDWRTEQYRDITFQVPADWGYAYEPGPDWCADSTVEGEPRPEHQQPYVALGKPDVMRDIACPEMPDTMITEHVAAISSSDKKADGTYELGNGFTEVTRTIGAVKLRAVSKDVDLAQRIVDSGAEAGDDALCAPSSPLQTIPNARPEPNDASKIAGVSQVALCQYDFGREGPGLRAATAVTGPEAERLISEIAEASENTATCDPEHDPQRLDLAIVLRVQSQDGLKEIYLRVTGCPDGGSQVIGGFDDGVITREASPEACRAVLVPPLQFQFGSSSVADRCLR